MLKINLQDNITIKWYNYLYMSIKAIITVPNPILKKKSNSIKIFDETTKQVIQDLKDTLNNAREPEGAGLAAPQIGHNKRICVVRKFTSNKTEKTTKESVCKEYILINPIITHTSTDTHIAWEGCLSVPNIYGKVARYKDIKLHYQNENGEELTIKASGFFARTIQHELDHLDGLIFTDKTIGQTMTEKELDNYIKTLDDKKKV